MYGGYVIQGYGETYEESIERNKLASVRVGKITSVLSSSKPSILPFKGSLPLIGKDSLDNYMDEFQRYIYFDDVPDFLQEIVFKAEQIVFYNYKFIEFLSEIKMSEKSFEELNPNEKLAILNKFLDHEYAEMSILELK